jgi:hypothetical protein
VEIHGLPTSRDIARTPTSRLNLRSKANICIMMISNYVARLSMADAAVKRIVRNGLFVVRMPVCRHRRLREWRDSTPVLDAALTERTDGHTMRHRLREGGNDFSARPGLR